MADVGRGDNVLFWTDDWTGGGELAARYPLMFQIARRKYSFVAEYIQGADVDWKWKRKPSSPQEIEEFQRIDFKVVDLNRPNQKDSRMFSISGDGIFRVNILRALIDSKVTVPRPNPNVWLHLVPLKHPLAPLLPPPLTTAATLSKRVVNISSVQCHLCQTGTEDANHLFTGSLSRRMLCLGCSLGAKSSPFRLPQFPSSSTLRRRGGDAPKKRQIFLAIVYGFLRSVWRARNDKAFRNSRASVSAITNNVYTTVFGWLQYRGKFVNCM
ncbi:hypothetical protein LXL04_027221 [Taraxacum kok-saghyz]